MSDHDHVSEESQRELLSAYSLGALAEPDAVALRVHLDECEACRRYLQWLQPAVDILPASVEQLRPSPKVREAILAEVNADAEASSVVSAAPEPRPARPAWPALILRPVTGFAAAALLVAGIAGYLIHAPSGAEHTTIAAQPTGSVARGEVVASLDRVDGSGTLVVDHLPRLPNGRVYEVWVQRGAEMSPESTFVLRRDGTQQAAVGNLDGADAVLVTQEPHGGSDAPTTRPLLRADLG